MVYPGYTPSLFSGATSRCCGSPGPPACCPPALGAGFGPDRLKGWVAGFGLGDGGATTLLTGRISVSTPRACARYTRTLPASAFPHSPWGTVCGTLPSSLEPSARFGDSGGPLADSAARRRA